MRERLIPFRKSDLIEMCVRDGRLDPADHTSFREFCRLLASTLHFEFHERLEGLKDAYAPFNADRIMRTPFVEDPRGREQLQRELVESLEAVLVQANYERVDRAALERALGESSLLEVQLHVDFEDYAELMLYRRGLRTRTAKVRSWFGLREREVEVESYDRVALYVRFEGEEHFAAKGRKHLLFRPGTIIFKLFQNIPKADIEMLLPGSEVRMRLLDKFVIGVPAVVGGLVVIATKLGATLALVGALLLFWLGLREREVVISAQHLVGLGLGLGALAGHLYKQYSKFKNRKIKFMKTLSENLYFKNLDNNDGVFHRLIDEAEEEEFKEAILAWYFLATGAEPLTEAQLDDEIERWFEHSWACELDFEVDDAFAKLERLDLAYRADGVLHVHPLPEAKQRLDRQWDRYFNYANENEAPGAGDT